MVKNENNNNSSALPVEVRPNRNLCSSAFYKWLWKGD